MKKRNEIDVSEVRRLLNLDPETGVLTRRVAPPRRPDLLGKVIGSRCVDGYLKARIGSQYYYTHRLVWAHYYGDSPQEIDHIDGDRSNNRLSNLRDVSHSNNCHNRPSFNGTKRKSASGIKGVYLIANGRYKTTIRVQNRQIYIGQFKTLAEAAEARSRAAAELVGEFANAR